MNNELLYLKLFRLSHMMDINNKRCNKKTITKGQGRILMILQKKDGISTKDLAEIMDIRVTSLNETLNKLEQKGYVKKVKSETDKRILLIYLTDKGREFEFIKLKDVDIFNCLNEKEKEEFNEYLNRVTLTYHNKLKNENPEFEKMFKHRQELFKKHFGDINPDETWFLNKNIK
ncbi:MAG: MarR family transcriptional regulator [Methanobrevibacter sp.]|uniref:MarR family winged helix-turn-helix transcriptional regulator n=1 Tax=Methanobrevibacter sp. TaxID=66852 RepID=UPI0025D01F88|nr:MarR family transcriptional regulator [Methanobrevibacter sp.]MBR0271896.1 MarR family transcriptional regulator [Methanobrevibacter sp.]